MASSPPMLFPSWPLQAAGPEVWAARARADVRRLRAEATTDALAGRADEARARRTQAAEIAVKHGDPVAHHAIDREKLRYILDEAHRYRRFVARGTNRHDCLDAAYEVARATEDLAALEAEIAAVAKMRAA